MNAVFVIKHFEEGISLPDITDHDLLLSSFSFF